MVLSLITRILSTEKCRPINQDVDGNYKQFQVTLESVKSIA